MKIAVIGLWHQGIVAASCLSSLGHNVYGFDKNSSNIALLNTGKSPIYEPGLDELIYEGLKNNKLNFYDNINSCINDCELIVIAHDTPVDEDDISDLTDVYEAIDTCKSFLNNNTIIHITAQIPVGTSDKIKDLINDYRPDINVDIAYSPENLRLGQAISLYLNPALPVIGCASQEAFDKLITVYNFSQSWICTSIKTAELLKHALNSYLATCITFANSIGNICDKYGVDGFELAKLLKIEPRVGPKTLLNPGLGFSGGTLARDVQTLRKIGLESNINTTFFDSLLTANEYQNDKLFSKISDVFDNDLDGRRILIWGLTYKPNTSTLRRSPAISLFKKLTTAGAIVYGNDPEANIDEIHNYLSGINFDREPLKYIKATDLLLVLTPWKNYFDTDQVFCLNLLREKVLFDPYSVFSSVEASKHGVHYIRLGDGSH